MIFRITEYDNRYQAFITVINIGHKFIIRIFASNFEVSEFSLFERSQWVSKNNVSEVATLIDSTDMNAAKKNQISQVHFRNIANVN